MNPSGFYQPVLFVASITSSGGGVPEGGIVTFMTGSTVLGTGTVSGGSAELFFNQPLPAGGNEIAAVFSGAPNFAGSTSKKLRQVVKKIATTLTLSTWPNPSISGWVSLNAQVNSGYDPPPDGETVTFMSGRTVLGTGTMSFGFASWAIVLVKVGITPIEAVYGGDPDFARSTSNVVKEVVEKAQE